MVNPPDLSLYNQRIREGSIVPWVGSGVDGCLRSAQVCADEMATLTYDDPQLQVLRARREAWLDRARQLGASC